MGMGPSRGLMVSTACQIAQLLLHFGLRGKRQTWGAEDTAFVFLEGVQAPKETIKAMRRDIVDYARGRPELGPLGSA